MKRPVNTLFMLMSVDGKISTGVTDERDVDKDYKKIAGIKEGLAQYYEKEKMTDPVSLNSGKVMAKIGVNTDNSPINCPNVSFVIIDNSSLTTKGIGNLANHLKKLYLVIYTKARTELTKIVRRSIIRYFCFISVI
jgi:2,5-diamino-6-(ribosylamino)-4(3H)-pyrimidinone 5'-phosphate reductase